MKARITVMPKRTVLDPQGKAVQHALESLGFHGITEVRMGKFLELELTSSDPTTARQLVDEACRQLLSNPVIEEYHFDITP